MRFKKESNAKKEDMKSLNNEFQAITDEELAQVSGGYKQDLLRFDRLNSPGYTPSIPCNPDRPENDRPLEGFELPAANPLEGFEVPVVTPLSGNETSAIVLDMLRGNT